jgi:murein hydrolase activator
MVLLQSRGRWCLAVAARGTLCVVLRMMAALFFLCLTFGVFSLAVAAAEDIQEKTRELEEIQARIKAVQTTIGVIEAQKGTLVAQLSELEQRYGQIARSLQILEQKSQKQKLRLLAVRKQRDRERASIREQHDALIGQMRAAYAMGRQERLKLILNQDDPARVSRVMVYYDYFNRTRLSQIESIQRGLQALQRLENELLQEAARLNQLHDRTRNEQAALEKAREERKQLLGKLDREIKERGEELKQLQSNKRRLVRLIASIQKALEEFPVADDGGQSFRSLRGRLFWPADGALLHRFGSKRMAGRWEGVLIGAREGMTVRAVAPGRVVYADWLRGYGLLTIIDHGDGYMTLYAFNQSLHKGVGDWVEAGDVIAAVGASDGRTRAGLYFEIRNKGKPVNPERWCRRKNRGKHSS